MELLCAKGFVRDAGVLLLALIEMRLDLQYMAISLDRADEWMKHQDKKSKPWKVRKQIEEIFNDSHECESEKELYSMLSMIKHGNPIGEKMSFPIQAIEEGLILPYTEEKKNMVPIYQYGLGLTLSQSAIACDKILDEIGIKYLPELNEMKNLKAELRSKFKRHLGGLLKK